MLKITSNYPKATAVLTKFKNYVVSQARANLSRGGHRATSSLYRSVRGYINKRFNRSVSGRFTGGSTIPSLTFEFKQYGEFLDKGVKGSKSNYLENRTSPYKFGRNGDKKAVPVAGIKRWLGARGLDQKLAYVIARSVYQKGIKKTMFFSKPFNKRFKPMLKEYHSAIADDIATNVANQMSKKLKQRKTLKK